MPAPSGRPATSVFPAVEYEFYLPAAIWPLAPTKRFLKRLRALEPGATIFGGATGVWRGEAERTHVYRTTLRVGEFSPRKARAWLAAEIGTLMAELAGTKGEQEEVRYTERRVTVVASRLMR